MLIVLAFVPKLSLDIPVILNGPLDSPGTLQLLALCLLFAGIALTYDVLFGFTGLLSFGHALYVAVGVYMTAIALTRWEWGLWPTIAFILALGLALPLVLGAVSLRVGGIAFAMVTLAFAQAGNVLVQKNPYGWTGGEEGIGLELRPASPTRSSASSTRRTSTGSRSATRCSCSSSSASRSTRRPGTCGSAIRENEPRVEVLGLCPYPFKLIAFVLASFLAVLGGVVWLLLIGGATPEVTTANFTLALLVMVVLGGAGTRFGAMIGGFLYTLLDQRLGALVGLEPRAGSPGRAAHARSPSRSSSSGRCSSCSSSSSRAGSRACPRRLRGARPRREPLPEEAARDVQHRVGAARRAARRCS